MMRDSGGSYLQVPDFEKFGELFDKKRFYSEGLEIIVDDIVEGIARRKAVTGGDLPPLEPETIMRKLHDHQLVDKGLLADPYTYQRTNQWRVDTGKVTIKPLTAPVTNKNNYRNKRAKNGTERDMPRDEVGYKLQQTGVKSKRGMKYFRFFGISRDAEGKILMLADRLIEEALKAL